MRRFCIFALVVAIVLSGVVGPMGMGSALAQEDGDGDRDEDELETDAIEGNESDAIEHASIIEERNETIRFGEFADLIGWGFDEGTVQIALETDRPTDVVIVDSVAGFGQDGAVQPPMSETSLEPGTHVVTMPVESFRGAESVTVNVEGGQVRLSSEVDEQAPDDPLSYFGGISGLFTGIGMTVGLAASAAGYVVYREDSGVIKA